MGQSSEAEQRCSEQDVLLLLRSKGLSIKHLDPETKQRIRDVLFQWYVEEEASQGDIAKIIGNKTSGYVSWLAKQLGVKARDFEEARLKGIHEKVRKYERKPFSGTDEDKAYMLGLRHGDLSAYRPWTSTVRVSTSTTHPALAELFSSLFQGYGHVYRFPRYKKDTGSYEWNLQVLLDQSFDFLICSRTADWAFVAGSEKTSLAYLAGLLDAEGSISMCRDKNNTSLMVTFYNTDLSMMNFVVRELTRLGYSPVGPYLDKPRGFVSPGYHIEMKKDYWKVVIARFKEAQSLLSHLPVKHSEKHRKKILATSLSFRQSWEATHSQMEALRAEIHAERDAFVAQARSALESLHKE